MSATVLSHAVHLCKRGFSVVPIDPGTKFVPRSFGKWGELQHAALDEEKIRDLFSQNPGWRLGLVCGEVSGHLEVLDFDQPGLYDQWRHLLDANGLDDLTARLVVERTPRGGAHVFYRCPEGIEGNQKLARRMATDEELVLKPKERTKGLIETRGEGGLIVCAPSGGYDPCQGNLGKVPTISADERFSLIHAAKTFETVFEDRPNKEPSPSGDPEGKPGWDFNRRSPWRSTLEKHGWSYVLTVGARDYWRRPGKDEGWSATTGNGETDLLYVFSTSCWPLESEHTYSKFAFRALMEFDGDYSRCAAALSREGFGDRPKPADKPVEAGVTQEDEEAPRPTGFLAHRIRWSEMRKLPPKAMLVDKILGVGDSAMIVGLRKGGKTAVVFDLLFAMMAGGRFAERFKVLRPLKVAYFTTEGTGAIHVRMTNANLNHEVDDSVVEEALYYFPKLPQLFDEAHEHHIVRVAEELKGAGEIPDVIVLDTFAKAILGAEENSNSDVSRALATLQRAREILGCATILLHHVGKGGAIRGASAIDGDLDVLLEVEWDEETTGDRRLAFRFAKDLGPFDPVPFGLEVTDPDVPGSIQVTWAPGRRSHARPAIERALRVMRTAKDELWTIGQIHQMMPDERKNTLQTVVHREATKVVGPRIAEVKDGERAIRYRLTAEGRL